MTIGPLKKWACSYRDPLLGRMGITLYATSENEIDTRLAFDMRVDGEHVQDVPFDKDSSQCD